MPGWNNLIRGPAHTGLAIPKQRSAGLPRAANVKGQKAIYTLDNGGLLSYSPDGLRWASIATGLTGFGASTFAQGAVFCVRGNELPRYSKDLRRGFSTAADPNAGGFGATCALDVNGDCMVINATNTPYRYTSGDFQSFEQLSGSVANGQALWKGGGQLFLVSGFGSGHIAAGQRISNDAGRTWYDPSTALANFELLPLQESCMVCVGTANACRMYQYPVKDLDTDSFTDLGNIFSGGTDLLINYSGVAEYKGTIVVPGSNAANTQGKVAVSRTKGFSWTTIDLPSTINCNGVCHNGRVFCAVCSTSSPSSLYFISTDGLVWSLVFTVATNQPFAPFTGDPIF